MKRFFQVLTIIAILLIALNSWARITYNPSSPKVGQTVNFTLTATNCSNVGANNLLWDFGDGTTKRGRNLARVSHIYRRTGVFTVKVRTQNTFTAAYQNPCNIFQQVTVRVSRASSSNSGGFIATHVAPSNQNNQQSSNKLTTAPITNKPPVNNNLTQPIKPGNLVIPQQQALKVNIKVLKAIRKTPQKAEINLKLLCQGRNLNGELRIKKIKSNFPLTRRRVSIWSGQFKTISMSVPLSSNDKKFEIEILDEDRRVVAKKVVEIEIPQPTFFIIGGFKFAIDQTTQKATTRIPINLGITTAATSIGSGTGTSVGQYGINQQYQNILQGTGSSTSGSLITVSLNRIGYNHFRLNSQNKVISGQFEVNVNRYVTLSNAGKVLFLKKITFTPSSVKAFFELNTASYFTPKKIQLFGYIRPTSVNIRLQHQGAISLTNSNNPSTRFQIIRFQLALNNNNLTAININGNFYMPDGSNFVANARLKTKSNIDKTGFIIDISNDQQQSTSLGFGGISIDLGSLNIQPLWSKTITSNGIMLCANKIKVDWADFVKLRGCRKNNTWMGILLGNAFLRLPANIMSNMPWIDLSYEGVWIPYSSLNQCCNKKFYTRGDINIPLISPKGVDLVIEAGSYIKISRNSIVENGLKGGLLLPQEFKTTSGKRIPVIFEGNLNEDLSIVNKEIVVPMPFSIPNWSSYQFLAYARGKVTITDSVGIIRFTNGDLVYKKIPYLNASIQGMILDGTGLHGTASTENRGVNADYSGFPILAKSFTVTINNYNIENAIIQGRVKFPFLDNIERNFYLDLLSEYKPMVISKRPGDRKFTSKFFDIDPKRGMIVYYQGTTMSNISSDVKVHLPFGISNTFTDVNLGIGPTGLSPAEMAIGNSWSFNGLPAQIDSARLYSEDDKLLMEVHAVFGLGSDWMSFPLSIPLKFFANGEVSGVSGEGSINIEMEGFKFSGSASMSIDTNYNFFFEGQGKLYLIDEKVGIDSYFTYNHRKNAFDYWRVSAKVTGLKVPIGHGMYIRGFAGGFAWNMKGSFDTTSLTFSYSPKNNSYGLEAAVDISTENDYLLYTRGLLSIQISNNGSSGMVAFAGKGWVFDRKHNGNPEAKVTMWGTWGNNFSLMASIQAHIKVPYVVEMPAQGGYGIMKMFIDKNGVEVVVGTQSNPWSIELLESIAASGYIYTKIWSSQIVSRMGYRVWIDVSGKQKIKYTNCYLKARIYGNLKGDAIINFYPNPSYHEIGTVDLAVGIMACGYGVDIGAGVKKIVNAPNPLQFIVGVDVSIDLGFTEWNKFIGIDVLKPVNSVL